MQIVKNRWLNKIILVLFVLSNISLHAQVNTVEFGRNRLQFKKFTWKYYQTRNFNSYFNQKGQEIAKFVAQIAEKELPDLEKFTEYSLQRRINIVIYNSYDDKQQSNIGIGVEQNTGGVTKLVNNKMVVYYDGNKANLTRQIREGIAEVLTENLLFGEDLGQFASNQTLLDLPVWLTDGYIAYAAENWSPALDDDLKSEILSEKYKNFYQLAFEKPEIAGHAFWYYIEEKYKKENVTYLLYLARVYKNLNRATQQVAKKKFKAVLADFMEYESAKYDKDIQKRRNYPKGSEVTNVDIGKRVDYFHFNVNPNKRNGSFAVVKYDKGMYKLLFNDGDQDKVLLKFGVRANLGDINPNYPMMAWDPKGTRLTVLYGEEGRIKLFVYDVITKFRPIKRDLTDVFEQVQDMQYMLDSKSLLFSAVKNGHTNIFTYDIENGTVKQITNDVFDNLDASFVAFPNKIGIIYASNRPSPNAKSSDTSMPSKHFNIFLVTDFSKNSKPELNQITQLSNVKFGNARYPTQYNDNHFTFVSDENGVGNRFAGFFTTKKAGLDTLVMIGDDILRNPSTREVDSVLRAYHKTDVDSIAEVSISNDSAYTFPLTNYASSLRESRIAGDNHQVSELTRESDQKILYKLKIDDNVLRKRNVNATPTTYMRKLMQEDRLSKADVTKFQSKSAAKAKQDIFQTEFDKDTASANPTLSSENGETNTILSSAKLYDYKPRKFSADYLVTAFDNSVLVNKYQIYQGGAGPIQLSSSSSLNGLIRIGTSDIMEDYKISGGFRLASDLKGNTWLFDFKDLKKRLDWGTTFYRDVQYEAINTPNGSINYKLISNLYQLNLSYPFDVTRSLRFHAGYRRDRAVFSAFGPQSLDAPDYKTSYGMMHLEYVYDNTLNPAQNIWMGSRYKAYIDMNVQLDKQHIGTGKNGFNAGFDARTYYPIYRNFIWAGRAAGDFSFGSQKLIYYLGGIDNWLIYGSNVKTKTDGTFIKYRYFNPNNTPAPDAAYAFQSLAVNMRGFIQNSANGNNNLVFNSEFRLPVFTTLLSRPINNAFLRNFQLTQFIDLGSAWNGKFSNLSRPQTTYQEPGDNSGVIVTIKQGGIGPFLGGYGFGARSTLFGYFVKTDVGWPMIGLFKGKPIVYFSLGFDF